MSDTPTPDDPFRAVVTAQTIYGSLQELRGELQADRSAQALTRKDVEELKHSRNDHESRLRSLEKWRYALPITSVCAAIASLGAVIVAWIN